VCRDEKYVELGHHEKYVEFGHGENYVDEKCVKLSRDEKYVELGHDEKYVELRKHGHCVGKKITDKHTHTFI
jgi:uncharacterized protein YxeA